MNETIRTYTELTVEQAGELLRDNGWKPVGGMSFKDSPSGTSEDDTLGALVGVDFSPERGGRFFTEVESGYYSFKRCAKATEIYPCHAPDGCPELEPWMAYIGEGSGLREVNNGCDLSVPKGDYYHHFGKGEYAGDVSSWISCGDHTVGGSNYMAIDVRSAEAIEAWPEHCRIRAYVDPVIRSKLCGMLRDKSLAEECKEKMDRRCGFLPDEPLHMDDRQISLLAIKLAGSAYDLDESLGLGSRIAAYYDIVKQFVKEESK